MKYWTWCVISCLFLAACSSKDEPFSPDEGDMQRARQVSLFESKDSQKKWLLQADEVDFEDMQHAVLFNPVLILRENGQDSAQVSGDQGQLDYDKKLVTISGHARVESFAQKAILTTERFFYNFDTDRVWSDKKTLVTRGNTKVTAKSGIETDSKLRKVQFKQQTTQLPLNPNELREGIK